MTLKNVIIACLVMAALAIAEMIFGVNDTGGKVALVLFTLCSVSVPLSLLLGRIIEAGAVVDRDMDGY